MLPPLGQTHAWLDRLHGVAPNQFEWLQREWASEDFYAATRQLVSKEMMEKSEERRQKAVDRYAKGDTQRAIAKDLGISQHRVRVLLDKPQSREELALARETIRTGVMQRLGDRLVQGTLDVVEQAIARGDAKSLDAAARAAVSLDKLTGSASGETAKIEVTGMPPVTNVDLKVLIQQILGKPSGPPALPGA